MPVEDNMKKSTDRTTVLELVPTLIRRAAWAPLAVFLLYAGIVLLSDLSSRYYIISIVLHMIGGVAITFFFWRSLEIVGVKLECVRLSGVPMLKVFAISLTATTAAIWELAEYSGDKILGTTMQDGLGDTILDMFLGIACGAVYIIFVTTKHRAQKAEFKETGAGHKKVRNYPLK